MIHQKKNRGHRTSKIVNPGKAIAMGICPIICSFYYLARALMHDVECEIACAEGCTETISADVLNFPSFFLFEDEVGHLFLHNKLRVTPV